MRNLFLAFWIILSADCIVGEDLLDGVVVEYCGVEEPRAGLPVVFYFHGTSGRPTVGLMRQYCRDLPCLLVGMRYEHRGLLQAQGEMIADELTRFQKVRARVLEEHEFNAQRVIVSGFSKGGWIAAFIAEKDPSIRGAAVLGAGAVSKMPLLDTRPKPETSVYIGIGALDINHINSVRLVDRLKGLNTAAHIDIWDKVGHEMPPEELGAIGLRQWLTVLLTPDAVDAEVANDWAREHLVVIRGEKNVGLRLLKLRRFLQMPYLKLLGRRGEQIVQREIAATLQDPAAAWENEAHQLHQRLIRKELKKRTEGALREYYDDYLRGLKKYAGTITATYMEMEAGRIGQVLGL